MQNPNNMITYLTILNVYYSASEEVQERFLKELGLGKPKKRSSRRQKIDEAKQMILEYNKKDVLKRLSKRQANK